MAEKKQIYQAETMALPPLKMVLGELPEPDPGQERRPFRLLGVSDEAARSTVKKIIGHIQDKK
jgi:hypothetical protein